MISPLIPILILGGGALLLSKKKNKPQSLSSTIPKQEPKQEPPKQEQPKQEDESDSLQPENDEPQLPPVDNNDPENPKIPDKIENPNDNIDFQINMSAFYDPFLQKMGESPSQGDTQGLWISDTCQSWGIGKDFISVAALPEKYLLDDAYVKNPDKMWTPVEWWLAWGSDISPAPWYINDRKIDTPARGFSANLIDFWNQNGCDISPPRRWQFKSHDEYAMVLTQFSKTPMGKLFDELSQSIEDRMYEAWAKKYPLKAIEENNRGWALKAVVNNPKMSKTDQTDEAYLNVIKNDPKAPKKIDPKNPLHKKYQKLWMEINSFVNMYRILIKDYGY